MSARRVTRYRSLRLAAAVAMLAMLCWGVGHLDRLPGPLGDVFRDARASGRDTGALFYTDVPGWQEYPSALERDPPRR